MGRGIAPFYVYMRFIHIHTQAFNAQLFHQLKLCVELGFSTKIKNVKNETIYSFI